MQNSRKKILDYLRQNRVASAIELSRLLDMTPANIRHHLKKLLAENQIHIGGITEPDGRGRPTQLYMLTSQSKTDSIEKLAGVLLDTFLNSGNTLQRSRNLNKLAKQMIGSRPKEKRGITIKLSDLTQKMNALGYQVHWEAHSDAPRVILSSCPYSALIEEHPDLCKLDSAMIDSFLGTHAEQISKISPLPAGPAHCIFRINN